MVSDNASQDVINLSRAGLDEAPVYYTNSVNIRTAV